MKAKFLKYVESITNKENYKKPIAFGIGIRRSVKGKTLDVNYPVVNWNDSDKTAAILLEISEYGSSENGFTTLDNKHISEIYSKFEAFHHEVEKHENLQVIESINNNYNKTNSYQNIDIIVYFLFDYSKGVENSEEAYFKLQALSQLKVKPHDINIDGVFGKLENIAWTNQGPILPEDLKAEQIKAILKGENIVVSHLDKFPYMVNYHVPKGVRIASGSQVRLGAHLASGTTVMPAGYINFNAGTLGNAMVEGRISAGVVVDKNTDIGGGASIMGTLSGGNNNVISIGEKCLIGANAGTGISLGYGCTIAAGTYVTAAAKISLYNKDNEPINIKNELVNKGENIVKGIELDGVENILYYNDSQKGKLVAKPNNKAISLNEALHTND